MSILYASGVLVLLAVCIRLLGRHDHVLVVAARGVLWIAVLFALIAWGVSTANAQTLTISQRAVLSAFPEPVVAERPTTVTRTPGWATVVAFAGPLADGFSTCWAMAQSGPLATVREGNGFYHQLFGSDVSCGNVLTVKALQSALMGFSVKAAGAHSLEGAIGSALIQGVIHAVVSGLNVRNGLKARRVNGGGR